MVCTSKDKRKKLQQTAASLLITVLVVLRPLSKLVAGSLSTSSIRIKYVNDFFLFPKHKFNP